MEWLPYANRLIGIFLSQESLPKSTAISPLRCRPRPYARAVNPTSPSGSCGRAIAASPSGTPAPSPPRGPAWVWAWLCSASPPVPVAKKLAGSAGGCAVLLPDEVSVPSTSTTSRYWRHLQARHGTCSTYCQSSWQLYQVPNDLTWRPAVIA
jgi:hypothetical protein